MKTLLPLLALGLVACSEGAGSGGLTPGIRDSAGVSIAYNVLGESPSQCEVSAQPLLEIGDETRGDEYLFYRILTVGTLSDGRIVVVNDGNDEVRVFSAEGDWSHSFGKSGNGPGEFNPFMGPMGMWIGMGDTIRVANANPWRYEVFDPDGRYVETISISLFEGSPHYDAMLSDGSSILGRTHLGDFRTLDFSPTTVDLLLVDADGTHIDSIATVHGPEYGKLDPSVQVTLSPMFVASSHLDAIEDRFVVGWSAQQEIAVFQASAPDRPFHIIRWESAHDRTVTPEDVDAARRVIMERREQSSNKAYYDEQLHPDRPVKDLFPAYRSLKLGRDMRVWAKQYHRPRDEPNNRWMIFSTTGLFDCQIDLPPTFNPHEFGSDYILGVLTEEDGAEKVVRYALTGPQSAL